MDAHGEEGERPAVEWTTMRVGDWWLDPQTRLVTRGGERHRLEPKMLAVLLLLVEEAGRPVARERLEVEVWSRAAVGTDLLNRAVWKLRRVLGDEADEPRYIETIPRLGYRLVAEVALGAEGPAGTAKAGPIPTSADRHRVAAALVVVSTLVVATVLVAAFALGMVRIPSPAAGPASASPDLRMVPLTSSPGYESSPALSPDGRFVAYQRYDRAAPHPTWDVVLLDLEGPAAPEALASRPGVDEYGPSWSASGDSVAYVRGGAGCSVMVVAVPEDSGAVGPEAGPVEVASCAPDQGHELAWMPDGSLLVASSGAGQTLGLSRLLRPEGRFERLTAPPAGWDGDRSPRPSPDGASVAFVRQRTQGVGDVYVVALGSDAPPRRLTTDHRTIGGLAWSPDGSSVVFSSTRGGTSRLWSVAADGGEPTPWPTGGRNASRVTLADDVLVYEEYFGDADLWTLDPADGALEAWGGSGRSEWAPAASPDGFDVAFLSDRTGSAEVWILPSSGGTPRQLTQLDGAQVDPPRWSPDGRELVVAAALDGDFDVYAVPRTGGALRPLVESPDDERTPEWWGDRLVYAANRTGSFELWMRAGAGADPEVRLTRGGAFAPRTTGGDHALYHTRPDEPGLWRIARAGATATRVWDRPAPRDWANWIPTSSDLLHLGVSAGIPIPLERSRPGGGPTDTLALIDGEAPDRAGLTVLPDGRILFSRVVRSESDLWIATGLGGG